MIKNKIFVLSQIKHKKNKIFIKNNKYILERKIILQLLYILQFLIIVHLFLTSILHKNLNLLLIYTVVVGKYVLL